MVPALLVVRVNGEIDLATAPMLCRTLSDADAALRRHPPSVPLVVDVSGVTFMDASGLSVLVTAARRARRAGRAVVLRRPSPAMRRLLELTRLTELFPVDDEPVPDAA